MLLAAGCFTPLTVDRLLPPAGEFRDDRPMAILPAADAPGFAGSGALLQTTSLEILKAKHFVVTAPERGLQALQAMNQTPEAVSRNAGLLRRFGESLNAPIIFLATFLDFRTQKSYLSSSTTKVWQGASYEYQSLPTYHQGICEMKVSLKILDSEKGAVVWTAEGKGRGPSGSEQRILRLLVEELLKDLPLLPEKRE
jgi:hypothetical protein